VLQLQPVVDDGFDRTGTEELDFDAVFVATGYVRNAHEDMLKGTRSLLCDPFRENKEHIPVRRDYKVDFDQAKVRKMLVCGSKDAMKGHTV